MHRTRELHYWISLNNSFYEFLCYGINSWKLLSPYFTTYLDSEDTI